MIGAILLLLGLTGWITRLARLVPQSVLAGLQLGLGFALALLSLDLMATAPLIAVPTLAVLLFLLVVPAAPAVPAGLALATLLALWLRSEEHTSELQSLMRISYAVFCLKKKKQPKNI